ncbi:fumarylacetoacetate hydrolase family protein [Nocardia sp. NEAU-G5]|uniref:Fumarylacetoacetate hydrolase family protein n=1 Tax=Nocardia albiluteola TaxID=2842303 RepID=A0ABS6AYV8_9NOCA|nr:fumarylacetoacetate hydrolase family protein [Nocardia albiluteola]MBU3063189.1 fumarylacetoacetate hydrolase family protein [Nocardia albiluteola]
MTYSLATVRINDVPTPVLIVDGRCYRVADLIPEFVARDPQAGLMAVFAYWAEAEPVLTDLARALADGSWIATELDLPQQLEQWLPPLRYPNKVICTGANYYDHMTQDGGHSGFSKENNIPVFFLKPPTTTVVGQGPSVRYPAQSEKFDYEVELAFVIGKRGRNIPLSSARDHIAGYTIALDMSARDWQRHPGHLAKFDLFGGKAFDDSCPLGPGIVPARFVDDTDLELQLYQNGVLRQNANTKDMIWSVPELVTRISEHVTLEPGDVVLTGTPAGVGLSTGIWTEVGDALEGRITGLGTLCVEIVPPAQ